MGLIGSALCSHHHDNDSDADGCRGDAAADAGAVFDTAQCRLSVSPVLSSVSDGATLITGAAVNHINTLCSLLQLAPTSPLSSQLLVPLLSG